MTMEVCLLTLGNVQGNNWVRLLHCRPDFPAHLNITLPAEGRTGRFQLEPLGEFFQQPLTQVRTEAFAFAGQGQYGLQVAELNFMTSSRKGVFHHVKDGQVQYLAANDGASSAAGFSSNWLTRA
ncbi:hypothetical protein AAGW05_17675 [Arthrobacter sp. LAPM80]|uniref:hypothetical protein n=1 Tax=Arthrobacter sp. LAPM80 TaxID=3141788 RepID=UPI00398B90CB